MKELDILLERFVDGHVDELSAGAWPELESLLQTEDDELWDWLQHPRHPRARPYQAILALIREGRH